MSDGAITANGRVDRSVRTDRRKNMAIATELDLDNAIGHIARGVGAALEEKIKEALMLHAETVVKEVAKQLCQNLKTNMTGYRNCANSGVTIELVIDGARHEF